MDAFDTAMMSGVHEVHRIIVKPPAESFLTMASFDEDRYRIVEVIFNVGQDSVWITGYKQLTKGGYAKGMSRNVIGNLHDVPQELLVALALHSLRPS
jgi:hypothetical protein